MTLVDIRYGIFQLLKSNASINAIVTADGKTRIYPVTMKQGETRDSIVYTRITETEPYHMTASTGLMSARFQLDAVSRSADSAQILADLIKETVGGYSGQIDLDSSSPPNNYVQVRGVFIANGRDDFDGATMMYRMSRDYFFWYADRNA